MANIIVTTSTSNVAVTSTPSNITVSEDGRLIANVTTNTVNVAVSPNITNVNVFATAAVTDSRIRQAIGVENVQGLGSLSYDNSSTSNGIIQYNGVTVSEIYGLFNGVEPIQFSTGTISIDEAALFSGKTTDDLAEGNVNLYLNGAGTTADLAEGSNLWYTDARVDDRVPTSILNGNITLKAYQDKVNDLGNISGVLSTSLNEATVFTARLISDITNFTVSDFTSGRSATFVLTQDEVGGWLLSNTVISQWNWVNNESALDPTANSTTVLTVFTEGDQQFASVLRLDNQVNEYTINNVTGVLGGSIQLDTTDIPEGANLYYTTDRANTALTTYLADSNNSPIVINGDLQVDGNIDYVNVVDLLVNDQSITLNYGNVIARRAYIYVDRSGSSLANSYIMWDQLDDSWKIYDGTSEFKIPTSTTDLAEGTNLYYTTARQNTDFDTRLATKSTTDLAEGTNLYFTDARADARVDLQTGVNLDLSFKSTSDLAEGTNLYWTTDRGNINSDAWLTTKTTTDLTEGTNLYYTTARANTAIDARVTKPFVEALGVAAEHIVFEPNGIFPANVVTVQAALDDLQINKLNVSALTSSVTFFPTTAASNIAGYSRQVTTTADPDYNTTAVNVSTIAITTSNVLVASLAGDPGELVGNTTPINITTVGDIRKTAGGTAQNAKFYFRVYKRTAAGTETLIGTSNETPEITNDIYAQFSAIAIIADTEFTATDRVVTKFYADNVGGGTPTYEFLFGGATPIRTLFPVPVTVVPVDTSASVVTTNTVPFVGILSSADDTSQKAFETLDAITTTVIPEGTNLYFTDGRADARIDLQTGVNLDLSFKSTTELTEGTNLYYTDGRADARIDLQTGVNLDLSFKSTTELTEGTNLYFTTDRANTAIDARVTSLTANVDSVNGQTGAVSLGLLNLTDVGADGTSGQVLTTDGLGSFTFTTVSGGAGDYGDANVAALLSDFGANTIATTANISTDANIISAAFETSATISGVSTGFQTTTNLDPTATGSAIWFTYDSLGVNPGDFQMCFDTSLAGGITLTDGDRVSFTDVLGDGSQNVNNRIFFVAASGLDPAVYALWEDSSLTIPALSTKYLIVDGSTNGGNLLYNYSAEYQTTTALDGASNAIWFTYDSLGIIPGNFQILFDTSLSAGVPLTAGDRVSFSNVQGPGAEYINNENFYVGESGVVASVWALWEDAGLTIPTDNAWYGISDGGTTDGDILYDYQGTAPGSTVSWRLDSSTDDTTSLYIKADGVNKFELTETGTLNANTTGVHHGDVFADLITDNGTGFINIGAPGIQTNINDRLKIETENNNRAKVTLAEFFDSSGGPDFTIQKGRGNIADPSVQVISGDNVFNFLGYAANGSSLPFSSGFGFIVDRQYVYDSGATPLSDIVFTHNVNTLSDRVPFKIRADDQVRVNNGGHFYSNSTTLNGTVTVGNGTENTTADVGNIELRIARSNNSSNVNQVITVWDSLFAFGLGTSDDEMALGLHADQFGIIPDGTPVMFTGASKPSTGNICSTNHVAYLKSIDTFFAPGDGYIQGNQYYAVCEDVGLTTFTTYSQFGSTDPYTSDFDFARGGQLAWTVEPNAGAVTITNAGFQFQLAESSADLVISSDAGGEIATLQSDSTLKLKKFAETVVTPGDLGGAVSLDISTGSIFASNVDGDITDLQFTNIQAGSSATLILTQGIGGTLTTDASWKWAGGNNTLSVGMGAVDVISVFYDGSTYYASLTTGYV